MRNLTNEERKILDERTGQFPNFLEAMQPSIKELAECLEFQDPDRAVENSNDFIPVLENFLNTVELDQLSDDDKIWLHTSIMYFVGELLIQSYGGYWFLQSDLESDFFTNYVIGGFEKGFKPSTIINPADLAYQILILKSLQNVFTAIIP